MWRDKMLDVLRLEPTDGCTGSCPDGSGVGGGERRTDTTSRLSTRVHVAAAAHDDDSCQTLVTARF